MKTREIVPLKSEFSTVVDPVGAFCGVGNPKSFFTQVRHEGYSPVFKKALRDHQPYTQQLIDTICREATAAGAQSLITTAKDAVKLRSLNLPLPIFSLEVEISIDNESDFKDLVLSAINK
jgi:tetraacyldisaccharide 4'-kinase